VLDSDHREGLSEKEIAAKLGISLNTVHGHVTSLYRSFGVHSRAELHALLMKMADRG
jgi:DNA-binding NarL/FixJ family response regulator